MRGNNPAPRICGALRSPLWLALVSRHQPHNLRHADDLVRKPIQLHPQGGDVVHGIALQRICHCGSGLNSPGGGKGVDVRLDFSEVLLKCGESWQRVSIPDGPPILQYPIDLFAEAFEPRVWVSVVHGWGGAWRMPGLPHLYRT